MQATHKQLQWVQPHWKHRKYELRDGEEVIARVEHRGSWKPRIFIILDQEELELRSRGAFRPETQIMRGDQPIANFVQHGASKNEITFMTGRRFRWTRKGIWSPTYTFSAPDNEVLMTFKNVNRFFRSEATVGLSPGSEKYPETRLLMAFGWYLMLASNKAATAATAGAG